MGSPEPQMDSVPGQEFGEGFGEYSFTETSNTLLAYLRLVLTPNWGMHLHPVTLVCPESLLPSLTLSHLNVVGHG